MAEAAKAQRTEDLAEVKRAEDLAEAAEAQRHIARTHRICWHYKGFWGYQGDRCYSYLALIEEIKEASCGLVAECERASEAAGALYCDKTSI